MNFLGLAVLLVYLCVIIFLMHQEKRKFNYIFVYIAVFIASLPSLKALVYLSSDVSVHMGRIAALADTLKNGYYPPRILTWVRNSYGWAAGIMYPSLFLYVPAIWSMIFKLDAQLDIYAITNMYIILVNIFTAEFMYIAAKEIFKEKDVGAIAAIFISLYSFRIRSAFAMGQLGDFTAQMCVPLLILGFYYIYSGNVKKWWVLTLALTFILETHLITTFLAGILCVIVVIAFIKKLFNKEIILAFVKAGAFAILINLMFLIPLNNFMHIGLVTTPYQFEQVNNISFIDVFRVAKGENVGLLFTILSIITIALLIYNIIKDREDKNLKICIYVFSLAVITILFCTSSFVMPNLNKIEIIKNVYKNIQFPRRWLSLYGALITIPASYLVYKSLSAVSSLKKHSVSISFIIVILLSITMFRWEMHDYTHQEFISNIAPNMNWSDYSYENTSMDYENVINNKISVSGQNIKIVRYSKKALTVEFDYEYSSFIDTSYVICPLLYYPVYKATDNMGNDLVIEKVDNHLLGVHLADGNPTGHVVVKYVGYPYWKYVDIVSFVSFILFLLLIFKENEMLFFRKKEIVVNEKKNTDKFDKKKKK